MQKWNLIGTARVPGSAEELRLMQRGSDFNINLGRELLMGSRTHGSEDALARLGCESITASRRGGRVLIGGLGMGFTLQSALKHLGPAATVHVAELVPAVVDWVRGPLAHLSGDAIVDARVQVYGGDVAEAIRAAHELYDAILLDVDNGPEGLTRDSNQALYGADGLLQARAALAPGGILAVWSAFADPEFSQRLHRAGFAVKKHSVRAHAGKGARHTIWVATRPGRTGRV